MKIIKLKAKVRLISEEQLEVDSEYDAGNIARDLGWGWRSIVIPVKEIYKIISFSEDKSLVITHEDEKILVREKFSFLSKRWNDLVEKKDNEPEDIQKDLEKLAEEEEGKE